MADLVNQYLKKVAKGTDDEELRDGILDGLDDEMDVPLWAKPKSSFKDANKKMKEIEDGAKDK